MLHSDIKNNRVIDALPEDLRKYARLMRLDRPVGIWLLYIPCLWGIFAQVDYLNRYVNIYTIYMVFLFGIGAIIMRSAGCIINDLWDVEYDRKVTRTKKRPLASGEVSKKQALALLIVLLFLGLIILLQTHYISILIGILSIPMIVIYPLMKRWTYMPQAFLGMTFNLGILMGSSSISQNFELHILILFLAGIFWTLAYDTIYAHQDMEDDLKIGVKSTAILFGEHSKKIVSVFYLLASIMIFIFGFINGEGILFFLLMVAMVIYSLYKIYKWNESDPESSLFTFKSAVNYGFVVAVAFIAG